MLVDTDMNLGENLEVLLMTTPHFLMFAVILFGIEFISNKCGLNTPEHFLLLLQKIILVVFYCNFYMKCIFLLKFFLLCVAAIGT